MEIAKNTFFYTGDAWEGGAAVNTVIIKGDGLLLIDPGITRAASRRQPGYLAELRWIAHTHCHFDHINAELRLTDRTYICI